MVGRAADHLGVHDAQNLVVVLSDQANCSVAVPRSNHQHIIEVVRVKEAEQPATKPAVSIGIAVGPHGHCHIGLRQSHISAWFPPSQNGRFSS